MIKNGECVYLKEGCVPVEVLNDVTSNKHMTTTGAEQVRQAAIHQVGIVVAHIKGLLLCRWGVIPDVFVWVTVREQDIKNYPMAYLIEDVWTKY